MGVHFHYGDAVVKRGAGLEPRNQDGKAVRPPVFAAKAERMHIDASLWARVCDQVASGEAKYGHLLLLQRVVVDDLEAIYEALKHADVTVRWNSFWVSTPTLARLARRSVGAEKITELLRDDLGALHILARFRSDKTPAVRRLFQRIHGEVLPISWPVYGKSETMFEGRERSPRLLVRSNVGQILSERWRRNKCPPPRGTFCPSASSSEMTRRRKGSAKPQVLRFVMCWSGSRKRRSVHRGGIYVSGERPDGAKGSSRQR